MKGSLLFVHGTMKKKENCRYFILSQLRRGKSAKPSPTGHLHYIWTGEPVLHSKIRATKQVSSIAVDPY